MRFVFGLLGVIGAFGFFIADASAQSALTYRHQHFLFTLGPAEMKDWRTLQEQWLWDGVGIAPAAAWRVDGDDVPRLPQGVTKTATLAWNRDAIRATLERIVGRSLRRPAGSVVVKKDEKEKIIFEGVGLTGREVDLEAATDLTVTALESGISEIALPVIETQPHIAVNDPALRDLGIKEVVTIGESDFTGSPVNRRHNIGVGLARFNGHLIPPNSSFSFNSILGRVDGSTGYRKELVIKGDRTEPDYGGGLCQISTTAYRGVWEYGFPIEKRKNHSYTVRYYAPAGTDATVYPGSVDMVFRNDMPTALLIQTHQQNNRAYFIYYGTRDERKTDLIGPFVYDRRTPPPDKIELTTELPVGERKKLNERVPGMKATWFRFVTREGSDSKPEIVSSTYEARPLFTAVGVAQLPPGYGSGTGSAIVPSTYLEDITIPAPPKP